MRCCRAASASSAFGRLPNSRMAYSYSGPKRERNSFVRRSRMRYHAKAPIAMTAMMIRTMPVVVILDTSLLVLQMRGQVSGHPNSELEINERNRGVDHAEEVDTEQQERHGGCIDRRRRGGQAVENFPVLFSDGESQRENGQFPLPRFEQHVAGDAREHLAQHLNTLRKIGGAEENPSD